MPCAIQCQGCLLPCCPDTSLCLESEKCYVTVRWGTGGIWVAEERWHTLDWCWQPDIWQVRLGWKNFSLCYGALYKHSKLHGSSHTTSFWQTQKIKSTKYLQSWQKQEVALCWLDTGGLWYHFSHPAFSRMSWACLGDPSGCPAWLPGWADMQELQGAASSTSASLPGDELMPTYHRNGWDRNPGAASRAPSSGSWHVHACPSTAIPSITLTHILQSWNKNYFVYVYQINATLHLRYN